MMREWKFGNVKSRFAGRLHVEWRKNPEAAPTRARLLEEDAAAVEDEGVKFDQALLPRA